MKIASPLPTRADRKKVEPHPVLFPRELLGLAEQYRLHSKMRPADRPYGIIFWPVLHSVGHAVELVLKAFHARKGMSAAKVGGYKHDLRRLLDDAMRAGLSLDQAHYDRLILLDDIHAELWARYVKPHAAPVPAISTFDMALDALFTAVRAEFQGEPGWARI